VAVVSRKPECHRDLGERPLPITAEALAPLSAAAAHVTSAPTVSSAGSVDD